MRSLFLISVLALGFSAGSRSAEASVRMFVRHEVADYAAWRKSYDDFDATRRKMGVTAQAVYRSEGNPKDITVTHDFKTADKAKAFAASAELKARMEKAGVTAPKIWLTTGAGGPAAGAGTVRMFVRHEVADYAAWRKGYDSFDATRKKMGVTAQAAYRAEDNPKDITVTHDFKSADKAKAFAASAELKAAMEKAGVTGAPQIWFTTRAAK